MAKKKAPRPERGLSTDEEARKKAGYKGCNFTIQPFELRDGWKGKEEVYEWTKWLAKPDGYGHVYVAREANGSWWTWMDGASQLTATSRSSGNKWVEETNEHAKLIVAARGRWLDAEDGYWTEHPGDNWSGLASTKDSTNNRRPAMAKPKQEEKKARKGTSNKTKRSASKSVAGASRSMKDGDIVTFIKKLIKRDGKENLSPNGALKEFRESGLSSGGNRFKGLCEDLGVTAGAKPKAKAAKPKPKAKAAKPPQTPAQRAAAKKRK